MGSDIFKTIIERKIDIFANTFSIDSKSIFKTDTKIFHPLEYGMYREKCFKELLEFTIDKDVAVADGFIITPQNSISTQCDLIIYESNVIPLIDNNIAKFFPIEIVRGIGEIKSDLTKTKLKEALQKLAKNKMLTMERSGVTSSNSSFGEYDYITTFLVCNKLNFDISSIDFDEIYEDIPRQFWHNAILSLEDGLFTYELSYNKLPIIMQDSLSPIFSNVNSVIWEFPLHIQYNTSFECDNDFIKINQDNKYKHVLQFLTIIKLTLAYQAQYNFDFVVYLDLHRKNVPV